MFRIFTKGLLWILLICYVVLGYDVLFNGGQVTRPEWYGTYYSLADAMEDGYFNNK